MRGKGINYDTGFDPGRLSVAGELAAAAGLEVWFAPFPCELGTGDMALLVADCADRAEHLRRSGAAVTLVCGCELSLFGAGFLPGGTVYERIDGLKAGRQSLRGEFAALPGKLNGFLAAAADSARSRFGGPLTYASGPWEPVDWSPFDLAAVDAYRDAGNAGRFRSDLRQHRQHGKPLVVTEFGCCGYAGAAAPGGDYVRDESEQVTYLRELTEIFAAEGVDLAFWFTFAGYHLVRDPDPRHDLDLASYGVVSMVPGGPGSGYQGLGWEPRLAFRALAAADWRTSAPVSPAG
jgi:hypothetical protein